MSEEINLEGIKKFWPKDAPDVTNVPKYIKKYKKTCGGRAPEPRARPAAGS